MTAVPPLAPKKTGLMEKPQAIASPFQQACLFLCVFPRPFLGAQPHLFRAPLPIIDQHADAGIGLRTRLLGAVRPIQHSAEDQPVQAGVRHGSQRLSRPIGDDLQRTQTARRPRLVRFAAGGGLGRFAMSAKNPG